MNIRLLWIFFIPIALSATTDESRIRFIVEDGGHMTFSHSPRLFDSCEFVVQRHGVVSVQRQTKRPRITYATREVRHDDDHAAIALRDTPEYAAHDDCEARYDQLARQLTQSEQELAQLKEAFHDLLTGSYDLPGTALSSQDAGRLNRRCAVLEKRFDAFHAWSQTALQDLPLVTLAEDGEKGAHLSSFIQSSQQHSRSLGTRLHQSVVVRESHPVVIERSITIDGDGHTMTFTGGLEPELVVATGVHLTLHNITLKNIRAGSIRLEPGAAIRCGHGVSWELHDNLTFDEGTIEIVGGQTVTHMCGMGGHRRIILGDHAAMVLKNNTLALSNITIVHAERVSSTVLEREVHGEHVWYTGALALCGNARVELSQTLSAGLVIAGSNNELLCRSQDLQVNEPVLFADDGYNELYWHMPDDGCCTLMRESLLITSDYGQAHFRITPRSLRLNSREEAGCVIGYNGMIHAHHLTLEKYPLVAVGSAEPLAHKTSVSGLYDNTITATLPHGYVERKYSALHIQNAEPLSLNVMHDTIQTGTTQMQAMQGSITLSEATVTSWGVNPESASSLLLEMRDGTRLEQGERPVEIREIDAVTVVGRGNEIVLNKDCSWRGQLHCAENSELTITCNDATLFLQSVLDTPWTLDAGARVIVRGTGTVQCSEQFTCHLSDDAGRPASLIFDDGIACSVMPHTAWSFSGNGTVSFDRSSSCMIHADAMCAIGTSEADGLLFSVDRNSVVQVGSGSPHEPPAQLSFAHGRHRLHVARNARIITTTGSVVECNMRNGVAVPGGIESLSFYSGGALLLEHGSRLLFAENKRDPRLVWTQERGGIYGAGTVGMNTMRHEEQLVGGVVQQHALPTTPRTVKTSARNIVASLINLTDSLHSTLYFVNSSGTSMIHTKGHVMVPLKPGESIDRDNTSGTVWGTRTIGEKTVQFRLNAKGRPQ